MRRKFVFASGLQTYPNVPLPNQVTSRTTFLPFTRMGNDWQGRPYLFKTANGLWGIMWVEGTQHSADDPSNWRCNIAFSNDEGATWSDNNEYIDGSPVSGFPLSPGAAGADIVNEVQVILCPNGDLVLITFDREDVGVWQNVSWSQFRSIDNGASWTYEQDFCDAIGATDRTKIMGAYEHMVVGNIVYLILMEYRAHLYDSRIRLFRSTDNCATYDFVSNPVEYDEADPACTESSIADLGNGIFFCIFRTQNLGQSVWKRSEDYGNTWGPLTEFSSVLGGVGVNEPRVARFANFFLLVGREVKQNLQDPTKMYHLRCSFWTTTDLFVTARKQYLDPYYTGTGNTTNEGFPDAPDGGYTKFMVKQDGTFVFFGYYGENDGAMIYKYEASNTGTPSQEQTSNLAFNPTTITTSGVRLQLNRDNINITGPTVHGGIQIISRAHNTLLSGTNSGYWLGEGTNRGEFFVINNKGWCYFDGSSRYRSVSVIANSFFKDSFSMGVWLMPNDGQPSTTQMIFFDASVVPSDATMDRVQLFIFTDGRVRATYTINNTTVQAETANVIFTDGAVTTPTHVAATFTSGGLIRIYINGVIQGYNGSNNGDISGLTMSSYNNTSLQSVLGMRQSNVATYDLGYTGYMREFILQPVVWDADDIADIMLN